MESLVTRFDDSHFKLNVSKTSELVIHCSASNMDAAPKMLHILKHRCI